MNNEAKEKLIACGVDYEGALARFMNNEELYVRFLKKFLADPNYELLTKSMEENDPEAALKSSHTLKGVAGNLSMTSLFKLTEEMVTDLRKDINSDISDVYEQIKANYSELISAISELGN